MTSEKILYEMNEITCSIKTPNEFDYLYVSLNDIEERAWSAIRELIKKKVKIHNLVVLDFYEQENKIKSDIETQSLGFIDNIIFIKAKKQDYEANFRNIRATTGNELSNKIVGVDISCMPTPQFFFIIKMV